MLGRYNNPALMRQCLAGIVVLAAAILTCVSAHATSAYTYKKGEYRVVRDGRAPNKQFSIALHGDGEGGYDNFHAYLMAEPAHRTIAPLAGIEQDNILDTAPDAYKASWSKDSRHVAVTYRAERHVL